jgi:intracellular septation protein A
MPVGRIIFVNLVFLILALLPIIAFAIVDAKGGLKAGVIAAIVLSLLLFVANWLILGAFDPLSLIEPVFFLVLGLISLRLKNSLYFKFQPVVVNVLGALLLAGFQIAGQPFLVKWAPAMDKIMPPENQGILVHPVILEKLATLSHLLIYVFLLHAAWVAYAALRQPNWAWVKARLWGYPILLLVMILVMKFG